MVYNIIYDAVKKKAATEPPNTLIGNVEMAACMGIILEKLKLKMDFNEVKEPLEIKTSFEKMIDKNVRNELGETEIIMLDLIEKYQVKEMVNESMEDLEKLVNMNI